MKKALVLSAMMLTAVVGMAKDIKTVVVTTQPQMHCGSCEKKITGNLRFEKGVKDIRCNIEGQRVTITYDAEKTNAEAIIKSFGKFGYQATEVKAEKPAEKKQSEKKDK
jgi:copper chaperone CopZ